MLEDKMLIDMCNKRYSIYRDINASKISFNEGMKKIMITLDCALHPEKYEPSQFTISKYIVRRGR